jgi:hypothetical protein
MLGQGTCPHYTLPAGAGLHRDIAGAAAFRGRIAFSTRPAGYPKPQATFTDTIASVRRWLWSHEYFSTWLYERVMIKIPRLLLDRFIDSPSYAA